MLVISIDMTVILPLDAETDAGSKSSENKLRGFEEFTAKLQLEEAKVNAKLSRVENQNHEMMLRASPSKRC